MILLAGLRETDMRLIKRRKKINFVCTEAQLKKKERERPKEVIMLLLYILDKGIPNRIWAWVVN